MTTKNNTLIILDWDDTLFPTSWFLEKKVDVNNPQKEFVNMIKKLDDKLVILFKKLLKCGEVAVVTNAMLKWIVMSLSLLPKTKKIINNKIKIISARDIYQKLIPGNVNKWKKLIFEELVLNHFMDANNKNTKQIENIVSIGDAKYEFEALIELDEDFKLKKRFLKAIRFMSAPNYDSLLDQIEVLTKCIKKVCKNSQHYDLKFEFNQNN